jgi:tRNA (mo5U34)-methyltransferase
MDAFAALRRAVKAQLGVERPQGPEVALDELVRFSPDLPLELDKRSRARLEARAGELEPWLQGPFLLGGDLVVGGVWRTDHRWIGLRPHLPELSGRSVLDVGSNAGYDPFMFKLHGAGRVVACEPYAFFEQAKFLESLYRTGVELHQIGWEQLDPAVLGTFDLVHCHGVLYHDPHPMAMLIRLREMVSDDGHLVFGSMMLGGDELSEYVRFVPGAYYGDPTWWWVPGPQAMRSMLEAVGFEIVDEFGFGDGPPGEFPTLNGYFTARRAEPSATLDTPFSAVARSYAGP